MMMKMKMKMFGEGGAEDEKLPEHLLGTLAMLIQKKIKEWHEPRRKGIKRLSLRFNLVDFFMTINIFSSVKKIIHRVKKRNRFFRGRLKIGC